MKNAVLWSSALLLFGVAGCRDEVVNTVERTSRIRTVLPVERRFEDRLAVQGNVQSLQTAQISSRTDGVIDILKISEGDRVKTGDLLFQVDKVNLENAVSVQRQRVAVAKANLDNAAIGAEIAGAILRKATADARRAEQLKTNNAIAESAWETAQLNQEQARANLEQTKAAQAHAEALLAQEKCSLDIVVKQLEDSMIRAPFDGVVKTKYQDPEEYVKSGDPIVYLEDPEHLEVSTFISANYYNKIVPGTTAARVFNEDGELVAEVPIAYRAPSVDRLSRTFELKIELPPLDPTRSKLVSGMLCSVEIILRTRDGYGVPAPAVLLRQGGEKAIFSVRDGKAVAIVVQTGIQDGDWLELNDGAALKDTPVVVEGQTFLNVNDRVEELANP